ncbi:hypothetical protein LOTGIDRAFT_234626 [Lottia gigantea]|uniref:Ribosomal protein L7Ae/L30e/S12e/Gadd45 domain-containing protein n=1 Tax=Lottia gigantea TaxID=225164 RepID=V4A051_LOTGI|nr:hypothetical protein LOTGIDRAFT_234626 [Lottia gigantea]ESO88300.1 hypothetical protein LOTGIDRAFT_234626 [Lottia gigantea]
MTLEEVCECNAMDANEKKFVNIGRVTAEIVWQSLEKGRLWCGGYELANLIKSTDNLMFCLLPEVPDSNVTASIEHTLIQAICWENNIRILRVNNRESLSKLLCGRHRKKNKNENSQKVSCVLLEYPHGKLSTEESEVYDFYKWIKVTGQSSSRIIQLPV